MSKGSITQRTMEEKIKSPFLQIIFLSIILTTKSLPSSSSIVPAAPDDDRPRVAKPNCNESCGGVLIPYPFGIGKNCSHNPLFTISCKTKSGPPTPLLSNLMWSKLYLERTPLFSPPPDFEPGETVTQISFGHTSTNNSISITGSFDELNFHGENLHAWKRLNMSGTPYRLMGNARNFLLVGGCSGGAVVVRDKANGTIAGCAIACIKNASVAAAAAAAATCYGVECCQSAILTSQKFIQMNFVNFLGENISESVTAVVVDISYLKEWNVDRSLSAFEEAPTTLQWKVDHLPVKSSSYANSFCVKESEDEGYICRCKHDYHHGNPYLPNGCQAIKACRFCPDDCISVGNKTFYCPSPSLPLPPSPQPPLPSPRLPQGMVIGFGVSLASMILLIACIILYRFLQKRKEVKKKEYNFKKNGGLLLHQEMRTSDGSIERTKLFGSQDLVKATDNFNDNRVLGRGGQGIVYKGMLDDGAIVAVKKSNKVSERQLEQFINEVVILSQVNHRNVVKLFGCCLETDVPLLVYEYVPNGTLYQHLHHPYEDFRITWKMRLQIAADSAEALAYLHSWSFSPIYHRDVKTPNILLDDKYKAKVSDFGTSKTLSLDQTHITTNVQGTIGYMDPEFIQSNLFTEKSDVYSFGIVLLELLTSKKPVYLDNLEGPKRLASEFLSALENSRLHDIVDAHVLEEAREQEIEGVADLASKCLNLNGKERPTMKEVAVTLHIITSQNPAPNASQQDFITREEILLSQTYTPTDSSLTISSTFGPR